MPEEIWRAQLTLAWFHCLGALIDLEKMKLAPLPFPGGCSLNSKNAVGSKSLTLTRQAVSRKIGDLLGVGTLGDLTCGRTTIDLEQALSDRKFVIINLSKGKIGDEESQAFGRLMVAQIQAIAKRRQDTPEHLRPTTHFIIDECHNYVTDSVKEILLESRKFALHLTLAQQVVGDGMSDDLARAVQVATAVKIIGKSETSEERNTAKAIDYDIEEIRKLKTGEFIARSGTNPSFKFKTRADLLGNKRAMSANAWEQVRAQQLERYYRPRGMATDAVASEEGSGGKPQEPKTSHQQQRRLL